ncbi:10409_t:CDS:2, partial [Dentiscutata erythropus]
TISGGDKYVSGTALYHINNDDNTFREITFKGFCGNSESLVALFDKNSIILMIGRYVYEGDTEYISLVQTVSISFFDNEYILTPPDLPRSSPLLLFSAPVVQGSYHPATDGGRESFMLSKRLYNGVTNNNHVHSNVIISYSTDNKRYTAMKNNLQKTVLSVIGRVKIGSSKIPHIIASDIEWTYLVSESSQYSGISSKDKPKSREELDNQLDSIEEKYATLSSQPLQKKPKLTSLPLFGRKASNEKQPSVNFVDAISQICANERHSGPTNEDANITPTDNIEPITLISTNPSTSQRKGTKRSKSTKK